MQIYNPILLLFSFTLLFQHGLAGISLRWTTCSSSNPCPCRVSLTPCHHAVSQGHFIFLLSLQQGPKFHLFKQRLSTCGSTPLCQTAVFRSICITIHNRSKSTVRKWATKTIFWLGVSSTGEAVLKGRSTALGRLRSSVIMVGVQNPQFRACLSADRLRK